MRHGRSSLKDPDCQNAPGAIATRSCDQGRSQTVANARYGSLRAIRDLRLKVSFAWTKVHDRPFGFRPNPVVRRPGHEDTLAGGSPLCLMCSDCRPTETLSSAHKNSVSMPDADKAGPLRLRRLVSHPSFGLLVVAEAG